MRKEEILVAFTVGESRPPGNIWRITAKKTDFYLDAVGDAGVFHLSVHGPSDRHPDGHRFHLKVDGRGAARAERKGQFLVHELPLRDTRLTVRSLLLASFASRGFVGCGTCSAPGFSKPPLSPALSRTSRTPGQAADSVRS